MKYNEARVKVMRSYDYCHFEISLGIDGELDNSQVDEMRKNAQRLADKAVDQYRIAKANRRYDYEDDWADWNDGGNQ